MPESGTFGSVRGVPGNEHSYRDDGATVGLLGHRQPKGAATAIPCLRPPRHISTPHLFCLSQGRQQQGQRGSFRARSAPMRIRKLVMEDGTWRCARRTSPRSVMRG